MLELARLVCPFVCGGMALYCLLTPANAAGQQDKKQSSWQQVTHASWYGKEFAGRPMAAGGPFNPNRLTAAHRTLAFGSWVRVTELRTQRSVVVQITDRGPYLRNRGIDLSYAAAQRLGIVRRGVARVHIELLDPSGIAVGRVARTEPSTLASASLLKPLLPDNRVQWRPKTAYYSHEARRSELSS